MAMNWAVIAIALFVHDIRPLATWSVAFLNLPLTNCKMGCHEVLIGTMFYEVVLRSAPQAFQRFSVLAQRVLFRILAKETIT